MHREIQAINWILLAFSYSEIMSVETGEFSQNTADSCIQFSESLYKVIAANTKDNIISSPLSAHVILTLLSSGAVGETEKVLKNGLHFSQPTLPVHDRYKSLLSDLNGMKQVELSLGNAVYIRKDLKLEAAFVSLGSQYFDAKITAADFKDAAGATKEINSWVEDKTKSKIKDIVAPADIGGDTMAFLLNAIYFKGDWLHKFETKFTKTRAFHVTKNVQKSVPTMFKKFKFPHVDLPELNARALEIPYVNDNLSMIIILPNDIDGLHLIEENFDWKSVMEVRRTTREIELYLPKFKLEATINLKTILSQMGMDLIFSDESDFSDISKTPLTVTNIIQKAFIEVNEDGSEAAAATIAKMRLKRMADMPEQFEVNRPFMFCIHYKPSNVPLFIGSVRDIDGIPEKDEL